MGTGNAIQFSEKSVNHFSHLDHFTNQCVGVGVGYGLDVTGHNKVIFEAMSMKCHRVRLLPDNQFLEIGHPARLSEILEFAASFGRAEKLPATQLLRLWLPASVL